MSVKAFASFLALVASFLPAAEPAAAESITVTSGTIGARLDYATDSSTGVHRIEKIHIERSGAIAFDDPIGACGADCFLGVDPTDPPSFQVTDFEADGESEVVAYAFTGGAHCCTVAAVFAFSPAVGAYKEFDVAIGDAQFRIFDFDQDGRSELHTGDSRFAGRFVPYAYSVTPVRILSFEHGVTSDISKRFRSVLRTDLAMIKRAIAGGRVRRTARLLRGACGRPVPPQRQARRQAGA